MTIEELFDRINICGPVVVKTYDDKANAVYLLATDDGEYDADEIVVKYGSRGVVCIYATVLNIAEFGDCIPVGTEAIVIEIEEVMD